MFSDRAYFFDQGLRFACQRCGQCCTGAPGKVFVGPDEIGPMADHLDMAVGPFTETYLYPYKDSYSIAEDPHGNCLFFDQGCTLYTVRPLQCRTFPFWFSNLRSEKRWLKIQQECPGIGQGRLYSRQEILERVHRAMIF
ncbi:MAG: YkgJ family cysteine cluster protein [Desulfatitalea sp.]